MFVPSLLFLSLPPSCACLKTDVNTPTTLLLRGEKASIGGRGAWCPGQGPPLTPVTSGASRTRWQLTPELGLQPETEGHTMHPSSDLGLSSSPASRPALRPPPAEPPQ